MRHADLPGEGKSSLYHCSIFKNNTTTFFFQGLKSFWRGVTASYYGVFETVIYMVLYQRLKQYRQNEWEQTIKGTLNSKPGGYLEYAIDFFSASITGVLCKFAATCSAYPHGELKYWIRVPYNKQLQGFDDTLF